jgi:hypothetical protein
VVHIDARTGAGGAAGEGLNPIPSTSGLVTTYRAFDPPRVFPGLPRIAMRYRSPPGGGRWGLAFISPSILSDFIHSTWTPLPVQDLKFTLGSASMVGRAFRRSSSIA